MDTKHDKAGMGFYVEPVQLAHDLTMLQLSKLPSLNAESGSDEFYNAYTALLRDFTVLIDDRTRYDSSFQRKEESARPWRAAMKRCVEELQSLLQASE